MLLTDEGIIWFIDGKIIPFLSAAPPTTGPPKKHYLYSYLKDQPIWQSLRFWNAAFFIAVQNERRRKPMVTR